MFNPINQIELMESFPFDFNLQNSSISYPDELLKFNWSNEYLYKYMDKIYTSTNLNVNYNLVT